MRCPYCNALEDRVVDSRMSQEGRAVRRRRECVNCGRRFTTYEYIEERRLQVVKRDGSSQPYDRQKIVDAIRIAATKRPISSGEIEALVEDIEDTIARSGRDEIASRQIGELVMDRLKSVDYVAYVRFASVYRNFQDLEEFYEELRDLSARRARAAAREGQAELPLWHPKWPLSWIVSDAPPLRRGKCRFSTTSRNCAGASCGRSWRSSSVPASASGWS